MHGTPFMSLKVFKIFFCLRNYLFFLHIMDIWSSQPLMLSQQIKQTNNHLHCFVDYFPMRQMFIFLQMKAHCCQEHLRGLTCLLWHMAQAFHDKTGSVQQQTKLWASLQTSSVAITQQHCFTMQGLVWVSATEKGGENNRLFPLIENSHILMGMMSWIIKLA